MQKSKPKSEPKAKRISPDLHCALSVSKKIRLNIQSYPDNYFQIEGDKKSLLFLGKLLISQAEFALDCGFQLHPKGSGSAFFDKESNFGLLIHRLPCLEKKQIAEFKSKLKKKKSAR